jgi:hypothetical protein
MACLKIERALTYGTLQVQMTFMHDGLQRSLATLLPKITATQPIHLVGSLKLTLSMPPQHLLNVQHLHVSTMKVLGLHPRLQDNPS